MVAKSVTLTADEVEMLVIVIDNIAGMTVTDEALEGLSEEQEVLLFDLFDRLNTL